MENDDSTNGEQQDPEQAPPEAVHVEQIESQPSKDYSNDEVPKRMAECWRIVVADAHMASFKRILEIVGLLIALGALYVYYRQLDTMSGQLREMQGSGMQTSQLIVNAAHQATETHTLAEAAKRQADAAVIQERPWVTVGMACVTTEDEYRKTLSRGYNGTVPPCGDADAFANFVNEYGNRAVPKPIEWWVTPVHSGQTPALRTQLHASSCVSPNGDDNPPSLNKCRGRIGQKDSEVFPIAPGERLAHGVDQLVPFDSLPKDKLKEITGRDDSRQRFFVVGRIDYRQYPDTPHWTNFCLYYYPHGVWPLKFCRKGNCTDDEGTKQCPPN